MKVTTSTDVNEDGQLVIIVHHSDLPPGILINGSTEAEFTIVLPRNRSKLVAEVILKRQEMT